MIEEDFNFLGVSENTKKTIISSANKMDDSCCKMSEIDEFIRQKYGNDMNLGKIVEGLIRSSRELKAALETAKNEATFQSDKEEIQEALDSLNVLGDFTTVMGDTLLNLGEKDGDLLKDDGIVGLIGSCIV